MSSRWTEADLAQALAPHGQPPPAKRPKYRNQPVTVGGARFDSKREAARWQELQLLARAGAITELQRQVRYPLTVNGVTIGTYTADFVYQEDGQTVVEDTKGVITREFRRTAKLMRAIHGIAIRVTR